jgi:hypothetical protein
MQNERLNKALGEKFSFKVKNDAGTTKTIAILAAFFDTLKVTLAGTPLAATHAYNNNAALVAAGYQVDAVVDDGLVLGTSEAGITCTAMNPKMSIRQFREFVKQQGLIVSEITIQANNKDQFEKVLEVVKATPLRGAGSDYMTLTKFRSVDQQAEDKIIIKNIALEMAFDTLLMMSIDTGREIVFTFDF